MNIGGRLKEYLLLHKIERKDFAQDIGINYNALSRLLNDDRAMNTDTISKILKYFPQLNARWLILGEGSCDSVLVDVDAIANELLENKVVKEQLANIIESKLKL